MDWRAYWRGGFLFALVVAGCAAGSACHRTAVAPAADASSQDASRFLLGAGIHHPGIPEGCIPEVPLGSTIDSHRVVHLLDGTTYPLPPVCPFLRGKTPAFGSRAAPASTVQGVWGLDYQALNPFDAAYNQYDAANSIVFDGGYAFFTQVVASWKVLPFPPEAGSTFNAFIGLETSNGTNGLGHGANILQPQVVGNASSGWSFQLVFCCDEFSAGTTVGPVNPGDSVTAEVTLDSRFPPTLGQDPSLGRNYVMGGNIIPDGGPGGLYDANFGPRYISIFVPALEGPVDDVTWAAETVTGAATVGQYGGGAGTTSLATVHSVYQYNPADGGTIPIVPPFNACRTYSFGNAGITQDCPGTDGASGASPAPFNVFTTGGGTRIGAGGQFCLTVTPSCSPVAWNTLNNCAAGTLGTNCDAGTSSFNGTDGVKAQWWLNW